MDGLLCIDKPKGWSSFDVIRALRKNFEKGQAPKMGHAGTLDPMATGLLLVLVGRATKQQHRLMKQDKCYEAEVTLGAASTTDDAEGELSAGQGKDPASCSAAEIEAACAEFCGAITQIPPRHSAIKIDGQRAYKRARSGEMIEMPPREVTIYSIEEIVYKAPRLTFRTCVSSGTYIRSLARDIGEHLGTGGYLSGLRRTSIGEFEVTSAAPPQASIADIEAALIDMPIK